MRASSIPLALALGTVLLGAPAARAQPAPPASPEVMQKVYACAAIADTTARLACYDAAVGELKAAEAKGDFAAVDAAGVHRLEREAFGFSMPSLPRLGLPGFTHTAEAAQADNVAMTIRRVGHMDGHVAFVMDNGQTWLSIDDTKENLHARSGAPVEIRRASLGSYLMKVMAGGAALRVRRAD